MESQEMQFLRTMAESNKQMFTTLGMQLTEISARLAYYMK